MNNLNDLIGLCKEFSADFNRHAHGTMVPPPLTDEDRLSGVVIHLLRLGISRRDIHRLVDEACVSDVMDV